MIRSAVVFLLLVTCCFQPPLQSQSSESQETNGRGIIIGSIVNATTQQPIVGVSLSVIGTKSGALSKPDGRFTIKNVAPGVYSVKASSIGFEPTIKTDVVVSSGKAVEIVFELREKATTTKTVEVTASAFSRVTEMLTSTQMLNSEEVRRAPGAQEDVIRAVSLLPGVSVTQPGRNDLVVRGGAPFENLFVVDNIEVPNINHFGSQGATGGPLTIINIDFVRDVQFSAGGFTSRFGDKLSSLTNISLRDGNTDAFAGELNLSATGFGAMVEGPLGSTGSYWLSVRRSYLDFLFKSFGFAFIPQYWDLQFKATNRFDINNSLSFLFIGALDNISFDNADSAKKESNARILYSEQNQYFSGITWKHLFSNGYVTTTLGRTFTLYNSGQRDTTLADIFRNNSQEGENSLNINSLVDMGEGSDLNIGATIKYGSRMQYDALLQGFVRRDQAGNPNPLTVDTSFSTLKIGLYSTYSTPIADWLQISAGARLDYYGYLKSTLYFSPRLSLRFPISGVSNITATLGRYYQPPSTIWLVGDSSNREQLTAIRADQLVLSWNYLLSEDLKFQTEVYTKQYNDYPARVLRPQAVLAPSGFEDVTTDIPFGLEPLLNTAFGNVNGFEIFLQKKLGEIPIFGLVSLSINRTRFTSIDSVERPGSFDNLVVFNTALGWRPGDNWEISGKFRLSTGLPTTPFDTLGNLDFSRYNDGPRLPAFNALDLRIDKKWELNGWQLTTYIDVQNVYGQKNVSRYQWNRTTRKVEPNTSIGILPSIGVNVEF